MNYFLIFSRFSHGGGPVWKWRTILFFVGSHCSRTRTHDLSRVCSETCHQAVLPSWRGLTFPRVSAHIPRPLRFVDHDCCPPNTAPRQFTRNELRLMKTRNYVEWNLQTMSRAREHIKCVSWSIIFVARSNAEMCKQKVTIMGRHTLETHRQLHAATDFSEANFASRICIRK